MEDVVRNAPLFLALDEEASVALRASMVEIDFARGQVVFSEGDAGDRLYVIVDGKIKLGTSSSDGRESLLAILGPGEMFGELSLFDPGPRTATATALTETTLLGLGHDALGSWLNGRPGVAQALLKALSQRLRRTNENLSDLVFSDVPGRVAKALLDLNEKFDVDFIKCQLEEHNEECINKDYLINLCRWILETMKEWDSVISRSLYQIGRAHV